MNQEWQLSYSESQIQAAPHSQLWPLLDLGRPSTRAEPWVTEGELGCLWAAHPREVQRKGLGYTCQLPPFRHCSQISLSTAPAQPETVTEEGRRVMLMAASLSGRKPSPHVHHRLLVCLRGQLPFGQVPAPVYEVGFPSKSKAWSCFPQQKLGLGHSNKECGRYGDWHVLSPSYHITISSPAPLSIFRVTCLSLLM